MTAASTIRLHVIDRDGITLGYIACKAGLKTRAGVISRFNDKTVWTLRKDGAEDKHRVYDGRLPSVYQSYAPAAEVQWKKPRAA